MIYQTLNFFTDNNVKENKKGLQHETDKRIFYLRKTGWPNISFVMLQKSFILSIFRILDISFTLNGSLNGTRQFT